MCLADDGETSSFVQFSRLCVVVLDVISIQPMCSSCNQQAITIHVSPATSDLLSFTKSYRFLSFVK